MAEVRFMQATRVYPGTTVPAVNALDLRIADGELVVLVGPSGSGKTTALRMLAGLEEVDAGAIMIGDRDVTDIAPKKRDIAMVFQNYALYPYLSVAANIGFPLRISKVPKAEREGRVREVAELLGLTEYLERKPGQLSGGQRQRVAMGRAIVRSPSVFLMDEPLSNLDAKLRVQMRADIAELQARLGTTTVYVTHDQVEAMTMGDRIAVMNDGRLEQVGTPQEVYDHPANLFVAGFIGSPAMNFFSGHLESDSIKTPMGAIPLDDQLRRRLESHGSGTRAVIIGIRPEDFEDAQFAPEGHVGWTFEAPIELTESMGSEIYAHFDFESGEAVQADELRELQEDAGTSDVPGSASGHAVARVDANSSVKAGQRSKLWLDVTKLHVFDPSDGASLTRAPDTSADPTQAPA